jgi:hypothetical protein
VTGLLVDDDMLVAGRVAPKSKLRPFDGPPQGTDRHGAFAMLLAAVTDDRNPIFDFDDRRFLSERRGLNFGHAQLLQMAPSRVAWF